LLFHAVSLCGMKIVILFMLCFCTLSLLSQTFPKRAPEPDSTRIFAVPALTVTSMKAERFQSPVAFAELNANDIAKLYTYQDIPSLLAELPSTIFYSENGNNVGYSNLSMRGFDQRRIAVLLNGIPQNDPEDHNAYWINLPDIASSLSSIQVQRGAGYASYGQAAIGGSVNMTTSNFANERQIRVTAGSGIQELGANGRTVFVPNVQKYSLEISSGIVRDSAQNADYAVYARISHINSAGYREQSWAQLSSYFVSAVRFDATLTTQINVFGGPVADGLAYTGLPKAFVQDLTLRRKNYSAWEYDSTGRTLAFSVNRRAQELEHFQQPHYELLNDWQCSDAVSLKSALFFYTGDGFFDYDASWADAATLRLTPEYGFPTSTAPPSNALIRAFVGNRQGGWIPRVVWTHDVGERTAELTAGAEIRLHRSLRWGSVRYAENLPGGFDPDYRIYSYNGEREIYSAFARERVDISEQVSLTAEAQIVHHAYRITGERAGNRFTQYTAADGTSVGNGDALFTVNYLFVNPRLGINFTPDEKTSAFGAVAFTSREPRMRNLYAAEDAFFGAKPLFASDTANGQTRYDFSRPLVRPERLLDVELGAKRVEQGFTVGVNAYWMEFFDELVRSGQRDVFGNPVDGNAPRTRHYGVEVQGSAEIVAQKNIRLTASANATFSVNRVVDYTFQTGDGSLSLAGNPIAGFPGMLANVRLDCVAGDFAASASARYVGAFYTDNFRNEANKNDAYAVVNVDASYTVRRVFGVPSIRVRLQVNNALNALYSASGIGREFFPAAERNVFFGVEIQL
jgi:iron complex outermembrane recepter protein